MRFTKMQGCGNDYIYVNAMEERVESPGRLAKAVSDRHFGIGADGLILIGASKTADFSMEIYVKALADGDLAIGMFNLSDEKSRAAMNLDEIGLPFSTGHTLELTEVWTCENLCANNASLVTELEPFASKVYRAKVIKL